jgi:hypothetical protein
VVGSPALLEQDVGRLHVAVHQAALVGGVERLGDLREDGEGSGRVEAALLRDQPLEVCAVDPAHDEVQAAVGLTGVVDGNDVRVAPSWSPTCFASGPSTSASALLEAARSGSDAEPSGHRQATG